MADEHRGVALVLLGMVAVVAVVGLVLLFVQQDRASGLVYSNIEGKQNPDQDPGAPLNIPGVVTDDRAAKMHSFVRGQEKEGALDKPAQYPGVVGNCDGNKHPVSAGDVALLNYYLSKGGQAEKTSWGWCVASAGLQGIAGQ